MMLNRFSAKFSIFRGSEITFGIGWLFRLCFPTTAQLAFPDCLSNANGAAPVSRHLTFPS